MDNGAHEPRTDQRLPGREQVEHSGTEPTAGKGLSRRPRGTGPGNWSKMVSDRIEDALTLAGAIHHFQYKIADGFDDWLSPVLRDGERLPDHAFSLELVRRRVLVAADELHEADVACGGAASRRVHQQRRCEHCARRELNPLMVDARRQLDAMLGKTDASGVHCLEGKTRRSPPPLLLQARRMVAGLGRTKGKKRRLRNGSEIDLGSFLAEIEPAYDRLVRQMKELSTLQAQELYARLERQAEIKAFDAVYKRSLRYVEAMFVLSGILGSVKKLRSYIQRRRLGRWARAKRAAYAAARMGAGQEPEKRSLGGRIAAWLDRVRFGRRRNVA